MVTQSWIYDAIVILYALSLLLTFSDAVCAKRSAKQTGEGLLLFVWVLQSAALAVSLYEHRLQLVFTLVDTLFLFSWLLVTLTLAVNRFIRMDMFVIPVNLVGVAVLTLRYFHIPYAIPYAGGREISEGLLFVHIVFAIGSYAAFVAGAVLSGMYLFLHRQLKSKRWNPAMKRLPSLEKLEAYLFRTILFGAPMLLISLISGLISLTLLDHSRLLADVKVANSILVLAIYACCLVQRRFPRSTGYRLAVWNLIGFGVMAANFILSNYFSQFHHWVWM